MPLTLIHGDHTLQSRSKLLELETTAKNQGATLQKIEAKALTESVLEEILGSHSLFAENKVIIVEELHSLPLSGKRTKLIEMLAHSQASLILWEKRALTKTMVSKLNPQLVFEFKLSPVLFKWLDSLSGKIETKKNQVTLFHETLEIEDAQMCFAMLCRQIRLLIQAKEGSNLKGAPFMIAKLQRQSQLFSLSQLLKWHTALLDLDLKQKTSQTWQKLEDELDLLLLQM